MKKVNIFILIIAIAFIGCERDDICAEATPTTPRLVIEFYDILDRDVLKSVSRLTAYGESLFIDDNGVVTQPTEASDSIVIATKDPLVYAFDRNTNSIELPLEVNTEGELNTVSFVLESGTNLRLDDDANTNSNVDIIEISYVPKFVYVSRACGYKSIFTNLDIDLENDGNNWISNIDVEETIETTVENENTIHVRIFH